MNQKKNYLIILVVSFFFLIVPSSYNYADAIVVTDFQQKLVVTFEQSGSSLTQVTNFFNNNVLPDFQNIVINKLDNNFEAGYTFEKSIRIYSLGGDTYQIYPKFVFSGTTIDPDMTRQQLRNGYDQTLVNLKNAIQTWFEFAGSTDIRYHIHNSTGSFDFND